MEKADLLKRPEWIRGRMSWDNGSYLSVKALLEKNRLNSVGVLAASANRGDCWKEGHVTFMIMGDICTRRAGTSGQRRTFQGGRGGL